MHEQLLTFLDRWETVLEEGRTAEGYPLQTEHTIVRRIHGGTSVTLRGRHAYVFEAFLMAGLSDVEKREG